MILLLNVKITDVKLGNGRQGTYARAPWDARSNRLDIFKYTLASYASMEPIVDRYDLYIVLEGDNYTSRQAELEAYIRELIPAHKLNLNWHRHNYTREWRTYCERLTDDDVIFFCGNDDHVFLDTDLNLMTNAIATLRSDADPFASMYYSHWPEQMRMSHQLGGTLTDDQDFFKFTWECYDGIIMMKASKFKHYWSRDWGDLEVFRTDYINGGGLNVTGNTYAPVKEIVRHFDGYSHVSDMTNLVPPLTIPAGFFDNNLRLRYGYADRQADWVNINAQAPTLYGADPAGADYRWVAEDIPLFWRNRITATDYSPDYDQAQQVRARDFAYLNSSRVPMHCHGYGFGVEPAHAPELFKKYIRDKTIFN